MPYIAPLASNADVTLKTGYVAPDSTTANVVLGETAEESSVGSAQLFASPLFKADYYTRPTSGLALFNADTLLQAGYLEVWFGGSAVITAAPKFWGGGLNRSVIGSSTLDAEPVLAGDLHITRIVGDSSLEASSLFRGSYLRASRIGTASLLPSTTLKAGYFSVLVVGEATFTATPSIIGNYANVSVSGAASFEAASLFRVRHYAATIELNAKPLFKGIVTQFVERIGSAELKATPYWKAGFIGRSGIAQCNAAPFFGGDYTVHPYMGTGRLDPAPVFRGTHHAQLLSGKSQLNAMPLLQLGYDERARFTSSPIKYATWPEPYSYAVEAVDNGQSLTVLASQIPTWLSLTDNVLSGMPPHPVGAEPYYWIILYVVDSSGDIIKQEFALRVLFVYTAPLPSAAILDWMARPAAGLVVAVKFQGTELGDLTTHYLTAASQPIVTKPTDALANWCFPELLINFSPISKSASLEFKGARVSWGSVTLLNDGRLTDYLLGDYSFQLERIEVWIGEQDWAFDEFHRLFFGLISKDGLTSPAEGEIQLSLRDPTAILNEPILKNRYPAFLEDGVSPHPSANQLIPQCWGGSSEAPIRSIEPMLIQSGLLKYQFDSAELVDIVQIYDNRVPVGFEKDLITGSFTLTQSPYGELRGDIIGRKHGETQPQTACEIVKALVEDAGMVVHEDAFLALNAANLGPVELVVKDELTRLEAIKQLLSSINAIHDVDGDGKFVMRSLIRQSDSYHDAEGNWLVQYTLTPDDVLEPPEFLSSLPPFSSVTLEYNRNVDPSTVVAASIVEGNPDEYKRATQKSETVTVDNVVSVGIKGVTADSPAFTRLLRGVDAQYHAQVRADFRSKRRIPMRLTVISGIAGALRVADAIQLTRFGLNEDTAYVIYDAKFDPLKRESVIEIVEVPSV